MNILRDTDNYEERKSCVRSRCSTARDKRAITRVVSNSSSTARQIAKETRVATSVGNVRRVLKNRERLKRRRLQREPWLEQDHKLCRVQTCLCE